MSNFDKIVEYGWLQILSPYAKDFLFMSLFKKKGLCLSLNKAEIKEQIGLSYVGLNEVLEELFAFEFIHQLSQKQEKVIHKKMKKNNIEVKDIVLVFKNIPELKESHKEILLNSYYKKYLIYIVNDKKIMKKEIVDLEKKINNLKDEKKKAIYQTLLTLIKTKNKENKRIKSIYNVIDLLVGQKEKIDDTINLNKSNLNNNKINRYEKQVIRAYENWTKNKFDLEELSLVTEALKICYPGMIISGIRKTVLNSKKDIDTFSYFVPMIQRGAFGKRQGNKKVNKKESEKNNEWEEFQKEYKNA